MIKLSKSTTILLLLLNVLVAFSNTDSTKTKYLVVGLAVPHFHFRDYTSSSLAYKGTGLGELHINIGKTSSKSIWQVNAQLGLGTAKPKLKEKNDWNEGAKIYFYNFEYSYLKNIKQSKYKKLNFYAGGITASNAQFILYPTINNVQAYNFTALSIQASAIVNYNFKISRKKTLLTYQFATQIFGLNSRPMSYIGTIPSSAIWNQNENSIGMYFKGSRSSSFHNSIVVHSSLFWHLTLKKIACVLAINGYISIIKYLLIH